MGKFYAVMTGEYEEYELLTICTNKEKAEEIARFFNADDEDHAAQVIECESGDEWAAENAVYDIYINAENGITSIKLCDVVKNDPETTNPDWFVVEERKNDYWHRYYLSVCAKSKEQAIKKAREKLTEYKIKMLG